MKKYVLLLIVVCFATSAFSQLLTWSPQFPTSTSSITITMDATKGNAALMGSAGPVYVHIGVITNLSTSGTDWKHATTWGDNTAPYTTTNCGANKWCLTIANPTTYFNLANGETIQKIAILYRNAGGSTVQRNTDGSDMYIPFYSSANNIRITNPGSQPTYGRVIDPIVPTPTAGASIPVTAAASISGALTLALNGVQFASTTGTTVSGNATAVIGNNKIVASLNGSAYDTISFFIAPVTVVAPLPSGVVEGINYYGCTDSVTLVLFAPNKTSALVLGDFTNWASDANYLMKKTPDGRYYWLTIHGLTSGTEYAYQYLVDNSIYVADIHAQKQLEYNDRYINPNSYPNLKPYPTNSNVSPGVNGIVSVLQVCEPAYSWTTTSFTKPDKKNLIIYELLVRDFSKPNPPAGSYDSIGNYQAVIDSIGYFKRLGINAIEFMPLQEFGGNISWGYNPTFYYAPDKVYGSKNKLKELIDTLHKNGIAVILDVVYNHLDSYNTPQGKLYWDAANSRPAANNPWLNPTTPHAAYKFFEDFNQTSTATQYLVETSLEHWINEYKVDGFRFDFTKGFTQTVTSGDNSAYDQSRIDNLNRYWDYIAQKFPNNMPYMILEHFCAASEENVLMNKGFMTWREMFDPYKESLLGSNSNKNFGDVMWNYNANGRNAPTPALVGFMGSHDKERLVYESKQNGAASGPYNVKNLATSLSRMEALATVFFTVPGPKMIWQFDEFGYDIARAGNTDMKAPHWEYLADANRTHLLDVYSKLIQLRLNNPVIFNNTPTVYNFNASNGFIKYLQIGDPTIGNTQITIVANLGTTALQQTLTFQKTGDWYNYISNGTGAGVNGTTNSTFNLTNTSQTITLQPGEYHVYLSGLPCATAAPTVTSPLTYCKDATNVPALTATGSNLKWYISPTITTSTSSITPSTAVAGTTTYYVTQTVGCESVRTPLEVNITGIPTPTISSTTSTTFCNGGNVVLTSSAQSGNQWYLNNGILSGQAGNTYTATASGNYTVQVTSQGCTSSMSAATTVTVNPVPSINTVTATPTSACGTSTGTLYLTGLIANTSYKINYSKASVAAAEQTITSDGTGGITIANLSAASYTNITATLNGCTSLPKTASVSDPGSPNAPTITNTTTTIFCSGGNVVLTSSAVNGNQWYVNGNIIQAQTGVTYTANATGNYTVTTTVGGCTSNPSIAKSVTVNPIPSTPVINTTTPTTFCNGGSVVLTSSANSGNQWYVNNNAIGSEVGTTYTASTTGDYTVTTTSNGCTSTVSAVKSVAVTAIPIINAANATPTTACGSSTGSIQLTGLNASTSYKINYSKSGVAAAEQTLLSDGAGNVTIANLSAASYTNITATLNGCTSSAKTASVSDPGSPNAPTISTATSTTFCSGGNVVLTSSAANGNQWYVNGNIIQGQTGVTYTASTTGNYTVTTTVGGCTSVASAATSVTANPIPATPTISTTTATTFCDGGNVVLTSSAASGNQWYAGGNIINSAIGNSYNADASGNYTVKVSANGCTSSASATTSVTENPIPAIASANAIGTTTCGSSTGSIQLTGLNANTSYKINYSKSGVAAAEQTLLSDGSGNVIITNLSAASYTNITATLNGCASSAKTANVSDPGSPNAPTISTTTSTVFCSGGNVVLTSSTANGNQWYQNGNVIANQTAATYTAGTTGNYTVTTTVGGCTSQPSAATSVTANPNPTQPVLQVTQPTCTVTTGTLTVTSDKTGLTFSSDGTNYTNTNGVFSNVAASSAYSITARTANGCLSPAATGNLNAVPGPPPAPTVVSPITYCQNATATALTATGVGLKWYTSPNNGVGVSSVTPSTVNAGSVSYYVSQTTDCGESQTRAEIVVNVTATPAAPAGLTSSAITNNSATVSWTAVAGASSYTVEYKLSSAANWTTVAANTTAVTANISSLTANTLYDWRVKGNCDANNGGQFSSAQFTTTNNANINNIKNGLGIAVLVNPITPASKITFVVPASGTCNIMLYNAYGQRLKIWQQNVVAQQQYYISIVDLSHRLAKGVYYLKIRQGNLTNFTKFIQP